jgi:hypothetical protein
MVTEFQNMTVCDTALLNNLNKRSGPSTVRLRLQFQRSSEAFRHTCGSAVSFGTHQTFRCKLIVIIRISLLGVCTHEQYSSRLGYATGLHSRRYQSHKFLQGSVGSVPTACHASLLPSTGLEQYQSRFACRKYPVRIPPKTDYSTASFHGSHFLSRQMPV